MLFLCTAKRVMFTALPPFGRGVNNNDNSETAEKDISFKREVSFSVVSGLLHDVDMRNGKKKGKKICLKVLQWN